MDYTYINGAQVFAFEDKDKKTNSILTKNTVNTWQPDRTKEEITENTEQGKWAEKAFEKYLKEYDDFVYITYDSFREDNMEKHAPFDGLLYNKHLTDDLTVKMYITKINKEVSMNDYGKISESLRRRLTKDKIFTIEIKSTKIWESIKNYTEENVVKIIRRNDHYIAYPRFLRTSETVRTFDSYCEWIKNNINSMKYFTGEKLKEKIVQKEINNLSDIQIRVYIDPDRNKVYLIGYTLKEKFFENPDIQKMSLKGKSDLPIYYALPIKEGRNLNLLFSDHKLWSENNDLSTYRKSVQKGS